MSQPSENPQDLPRELRSLLRSCYPGRLRAPQIIIAMEARGFATDGVPALIEKLASEGSIQRLILPDGTSIYNGTSVYRCPPLAGGQTDHDVAEPVFEDWNRLLERLPGITDPKERIEAIANNAGASDTRDFGYLAVEQKLVDSFGEFAELRFRERLAVEQRAFKQAGCSDAAIGVSVQLKAKRLVLDECKILYNDALARIGTSSVVYANESLQVAVEKRVTETVECLIRLGPSLAVETPATLGVEESSSRTRSLPHKGSSELESNHAAQLRMELSNRPTANTGLPTQELASASRIQRQIRSRREDTGGEDLLDSDSNRDLAFGSEAERNRAVSVYTNSRKCSEAALARTATVDPADLSRWKKGLLPPGSDKKARIEAALRKNKPPTPTAKQEPES